MKSQRSKRGSALLTVVMLTAMMAILTASMLRYTGAEKRFNERNRLILRARNMAENISIYAAEQLTTKLYRTRATTAMAFMTGSNNISLPDSTGNKNVLNTVKYSNVSGMEVRAGMLAPTNYTLVTDTSSNNYGLQVSTATVPIIAKASTTHPVLGTQTSHVLQEMEIAMTPLFQFGIFYNMDLELFPGQTMTIMGPVHTNGRLIARGEVGGTAVITFTDRVSAAKGLYADGQLKVGYRNRAGSVTAGAGGTGAVNYTATSGSQFNLNNGTIWRDHKWGLASESATTLLNFKNFATTTYGSNVRTNVHGVTPLNLPSVGDYNEVNLTTTPEDDRNNGRQLIEPPNPNKYNGTSWVATTDDADAKETKISWKAGLYIAVNPDKTVRSCTLPDGTTAYVTPWSYRCWLNSIDSSNVHTCTEVVLPGQPSYGYNRGADATLGTADDYMYRNNLPNFYTTDTTVGSNQVLRIPMQDYGTGSGYLVNNGAGCAAGDTVIALDTGTGSIVAGDTVTINGLKYTVNTAYNGTSITLASGLRGAVADNTPVYVDAPSGFVGTGTGYLINNGAGYAIGATTLALDTGTGSILAGNTITIGSFKYLVVGALANGSVNIAPPGLRAAVIDNTPVTLDPLSGTRGTGNGYLINGALTSVGWGDNAHPVNVNTGTGTIMPGNTITIPGTGGYTYTVASVNTGANATVLTITPLLYATVANSTKIALNQLVGPGYIHTTGRGSGYLVNNVGGYAIGATSLNVDTGTGIMNPGDLITIGSYQYLIHKYYAGGAGTIEIPTPGLLAAATNDSLVTLESRSGCSFPAEADFSPFPSESYFYDLRRANGNNGYTCQVAGGTGRGTTNYIPRAIAKIDLDMARFKMMVARSASVGTTSTGFKVQAPDAGNWTNSIFNSAGVTTTLDLGLDDPSTGTVTTPAYSLLPPAAGGTLEQRTRQDPFRMYYAPATPVAAATITAIYDDPRVYAVPTADIYDGTIPDAWFDGLAVYVCSMDAERRAQTAGVPDRVDSGVRLLNGRGPVASLTATGKTGFTFATNDAAYLIGHFNADGTVNTTTSSTSGANPYSARWPDSTNEYLTAVMSDAITLLSQPVYSNASSPYPQTNGWNDALSAFRVTNATWLNTWRSTNPSSTNNYEGIGASATAIKPGALPNNSTPGGGGTTWQTKLPPVSTEFSVCMLMGMVPSNHNATGLTDLAPVNAANAHYSGGAHNFPRLLDDWHCDMGSTVTAGLFIRGSMVALFESRVAMEPYNIRTYQAPARYWGLHESLRTAGHDVPLEPIVLACTRRRYMEMTAGAYATMKATIEALPH